METAILIPSLYKRQTDLVSTSRENTKAAIHDFIQSINSDVHGLQPDPPKGIGSLTIHHDNGDLQYNSDPDFNLESSVDRP